MNNLDHLLTGEEIRFSEAEKYFGDKLVITAKEFYQLGEKYRNLAFTVSGYTKAQILNTFRNELLKAIQEGGTLYSFRSNMDAFLGDHGYAGMTPFQADTIFRTNIQTAYQVGHYEQMTAPAVLESRPYWQYDAVNDSTTRPSHLAMDGKVFPADSKVWDVWYPPNGFRCRCSVQTLSQREVDRMGLRVETTVPRGVELPDGRFMPLMPDQGFGTNPAKVAYQPDTQNFPPQLVKAYEKHQKNHRQPIPQK